MPVRLYGLLTWTTLRRLPLIHEKLAEFLRRVLPEIARRHDARVVEIGIVRNHLHLIVELSRRPDLPRLVQGLKGASARIANRDGYMPRARLQWATGYDFRSLGVRDLQRAISYVRDQAQRHPELAIEDNPAESPGSAVCAHTRAKSPGSAMRAPCKGALPPSAPS